MKKLYCLSLLCLLPTLAYAQFNDVPDFIPEETIYPDENYEREMGIGEVEQQDLMHSAAEPPQLEKYDHDNSDEYYSEVEE